MITREQYFGRKVEDPACTPEMIWNADHLLLKVNPLLEEARAAGVYDWGIDPDTGTCISGSRGGSGDGGFRLPNTKTGTATSTHRTADGIDVYDPRNRLDVWISSFDTDGGKRNSLLEKYGLYREAPSATDTWCHLQQRAPGSGRRTYNP